MKKILFAVVIAAAVGAAHAEDTVDYRVTGRFIVDATHLDTKKIVPELWSVNAREILREGKIPTIRFDFVRARLSPLDTERWKIDDMFVYHYTLGKGKALFQDGSFIFEFGEDTTTKLRIDCNPDGSLKDITGTAQSRAGSDGVKFKLSSAREKLVIVENNSFKNKTYSYQKRVSQDLNPADTQKKH
jgi:hypothetical protein